MSSRTNASGSPSGSEARYSLLLCVFLTSSRVWLRLLTRLTLLQPEFYTSCHTKAQYDEVGPSICRRYQIFGSAT